MKKTLFATTACLGTVVVATLAVNAAPQDYDNKTTTGSLELKESDELVFPTNPVTPAAQDPRTNDPIPNSLPPGVIIDTTGAKEGTPLTPGTQVDKDYPNLVFPVKSGSLAFVLVPSSFDFGEQKLTASDKLKAKLTFTQLAPKEAVDKGYQQDVQVHDGRIDVKGYRVTAKLQGFDKLPGATLRLDDVSVHTTQFSGKATGHGFTNPTQGLAVSTGSDTVLVSDATNNPVNGDATIYWDFANVKLEIPGSSITKGKHTGTVEWTISSEPNV